MNDIYDLTAVIPMHNFPWHEIMPAIDISRKTPTHFYGHPKDSPLLGKDVFLTNPKDWKTAWYMLGEEEHWTRSINVVYFPLLVDWISKLNIFKGIGRIVILIQDPNKFTPPHIDMDITRAPVEYQKPIEFIWITPPVNGKQLFVNDNPAPYVCWFNSYAIHRTEPKDAITWSLRIDGKFTDQFKQNLLVL